MNAHFLLLPPACLLVLLYSALPPVGPSTGSSMSWPWLSDTQNAPRLTPADIEREENTRRQQVRLEAVERFVPDYSPMTFAELHDWFHIYEDNLPCSADVTYGAAQGLLAGIRERRVERGQSVIFCLNKAEIGSRRDHR